MTAQGLGGLLIGGLVGDLVFRRIGDFQRVVWVALAFIGLLLIVT